MRITRRDLAALRAYLRRRMFRGFFLVFPMPPWRTITGGTVLLDAAFRLAVYRRVAGGTRGDVVRFVARARIRRGPGGPNTLEPLPAERVIMAVLTGTPAAGLTGWQRAKSLILLNELIDDEGLDDAGLEDFVAQAVRLASGGTAQG